LRRITDVLLTLVPLLVAIVVTLELSVALDLPLELCQHHRPAAAARVASPSKSITLWPGAAEKTALVQSTLTRAVIFSAMTQATAFAAFGCQAIRVPRAWAN